jgi:hypothetical protein
MVSGDVPGQMFLADSIRAQESLRTGNSISLRPEGQHCIRIVYFAPRNKRLTTSAAQHLPPGTRRGAPFVSRTLRSRSAPGAARGTPLLRRGDGEIPGRHVLERDQF